MTRARLVALPCLLAAALAASSAAVAAQSADRAALYRAVLALRATDLDGRVWTHEALQGRIVLVDFWATWCPPCLRELPYLRQARSRYGADFRILGISLDSFGHLQLQDWLNRHEVTWPQVHARGAYDDPIAVAFGIDRLPTNLLLDRQGRLRAVNVRRESLFEEVDKLLREERR